MYQDSILAIVTNYILLGIACEAITEIIVDSEISAMLFRDKLRKLAYSEESEPNAFVLFIDKLVNCGYCTSVWVAMPMAVFAPPITGRIVDIILSVMLIHRLANAVHVIYELIRRGRVRTYDLAVKLDSEYE